METVILPKEKFEQMKQEIIFLISSLIYKRLLEFERNICRGRKFSRDDLGF